MLGSNGTALSPLSFEELDYGLLKCRLIRRGVVVAITFGGAGRWHFFEEPFDFLIGHVGLAIEYQDRYVDFSECFRRPSRCDCTANHSRQNLRISSRRPSRYESRRGEVPRNDFFLL